MLSLPRKGRNKTVGAGTQHADIAKSFACPGLFHPLSSPRSPALPSLSDTESLLNCFAQGHTDGGWARPYICKKKWLMLVISIPNTNLKIGPRWE